MSTSPLSTTPAMSARVQVAVSRLRDLRERVTPARTAVIEVLDQATGHLSADDVTTLATARAPGVHRATVYRALGTLTELGLVTHVHVGGAATVYHLALPDPTAHPAAHPADDPAAGVPGGHLHLQCTTCKAVIDAPGALLDEAAARLADELGFRLEPEHTALLGTCARCRA